MRPHDWQDVKGIWHCSGCGLCGGLLLGQGDGPRRIFLSGEGGRFTFPLDDCDHARDLVAELKASPYWVERQRDLRKGHGLWVLATMQHRGVGGKVEKDGTVRAGNGRRKFQIFPKDDETCIVRIDGVDDDFPYYGMLDRLHAHYAGDLQQVVARDDRAYAWYLYIQDTHKTPMIHSADPATRTFVVDPHPIGQAVDLMRSGYKLSVYRAGVDFQGEMVR
jgi:hypothetical protein